MKGVRRRGNIRGTKWVEYEEKWIKKEKAGNRFPTTSIK